MFEEGREFVHLFYFGCVAVESSHVYRWAAAALFVGGSVALIIKWHRHRKAHPHAHQHFRHAPMATKVRRK